VPVAASQPKPVKFSVYVGTRRIFIKSYLIPKVKYNEIAKEVDILHCELGGEIF